MPYLAQVLLLFLSYALTVVQFAILIRVLLPLIAPDTENPFLLLAVFVSELFVAPVRYVMDRFDFLQNSIIDFSVMVTILLLGGLDTLISFCV